MIGCVNDVNIVLWVDRPCFIVFCIILQRLSIESVTFFAVFITAALKCCSSQFTQYVAMENGSRQIRTVRCVMWWTVSFTLAEVTFS